MRKFTAAEVQAIIEAERRGEFQLPEGDYTDATLTAALERIDTAAAYKITARRAIAEMEQPAPAYKPQSKVGAYLSCQYCHKPAGDHTTKERGICYDCERKMVDEGHAWEENKIASGTDLYQQMRADLYRSQHPGTSMDEALRIVNQR